MVSTKIEKIIGREILDSRGNPTVEAEVYLRNGISGRASVPSGASTGKLEAHELRDKETRYNGKGVLKAVSNVNIEIADILQGYDALNQTEIDKAMIDADGTENKSRLGANSILAVSLATAKAAAKASGLPLYRYIGGAGARRLPVPMMNIINGGKHADSSLNIQEFMLMPVSPENFTDALEKCVRIFHNLGKLLSKDGLSTSVGDEGGYSPKFKSDEEALRYLVDAIEATGYIPGKDFAIAVDAAASEMKNEAEKIGRQDQYLFWKSGELMTVEDIINYWDGLCKKYPLISIEDGMAEDDYEGWIKLTQRIGSRVQLVGDDLFVTNTGRIREGMKSGTGNAVLIKPNQIGTLSETIEAINMTIAAGWKSIVSHRSGETEDSYIADIAVGMNTGQIKTGAPSRGERTAKYNKLLRIEQQLGITADYLPPTAQGLVSMYR